MARPTIRSRRLRRSSILALLSVVAVVAGATLWPASCQRLLEPVQG